MIWKLLIIYFSISVFNFLKNAYRMVHTNFLRNTYIKNIKEHHSEKNYELLIPIVKVLSKANVYVYNIESELNNNFGISQSFDNSFMKAFYHYKYLSKHSLTWITRIPFPKFKFIHNKKLNIFLRFLVFAISTIAVYLLGLYLDNSGLGLKALNYLTDFVNNLF